jgi:hypothetical protein
VQSWLILAIALLLILALSNSKAVAASLVHTDISESLSRSAT